MVRTNKKGARQVVMSSCSISTENQNEKRLQKDSGPRQLHISFPGRTLTPAGDGSHWDVTKQTHSSCLDTEEGH